MNTDNDFAAPTNPEELDRFLHGIVMMASSAGDWYFQDEPTSLSAASNGVPPVLPCPESSPEGGSSKPVPHSPRAEQK